MVQMGTGAFDTASALRNQSQSGASSLSSNSMMMGSFVKRSKLAIQNIDRNFLTPILKKVQWRYMQFDPIRYPKEIDFNPRPTLGIVAREVEAMQMTQLVGMLPEDFHQAKLVLAKGIVENTSFPNKQEVIQVIQSILNPSPQQQQQTAQMQHMQQMEVMAQAQLAMAQVKKIGAEINEINARAGKEGHAAAVATESARNDRQRVMNEQQELGIQRMQAMIAAAQLPIKRLQAQAAMKSASRPAASTSKK